MTGEEIKRVRENNGLTQSDLANKLLTTVTTISRWENNKSKPSKLYLRELNKLK